MADYTPDSDEDTFGPGARVSVLLPLPLAGAYDYRVGGGQLLRAGDIVRVPLGARRMVGVVWGAGTAEGAGGVADKKLKEVAEVLPAPPMTDALRRLIDRIAAYTVTKPGAVLKMALPVADALEPEPPITAVARVGALPPGLRLTPTRTRVLDVLEAGPPRPAADIARAAGVSPSVVTGLVGAGALQTITLARTQTPAPIFRAGDPAVMTPTLSGDQAAAAAALCDAVSKGAFDAFALDGVTGSGKTEVYFEAIATALEKGSQVLVLLPEIALGSQWLRRFEERFGFAPAPWHSELTPARRRTIWRDVAGGRVPVVVGARSSLFLPFPDLGLIVVDEEHDAAFKQEEGVIYNARDMAVMRAHIEGAPVVLASATLSLETVVNVERGKYKRLHLADRHGGAVMPAVALIDVRGAAVGTHRWISPALKEAVDETLAAGEQAMLFLNRRGYAPLTLCRTCGHRFQCPNCTAWLVEHRHANRLQCHHCGHTVPKPETCPECDHKDTLAVCGPGVERLAEEAAETFPDARIAIAASDTIAGPRAAHDLVARIENHEVDLLIGTQIVAKGYHFPLLTLVGVVDADLGLAGGDLRAAERTYQLLHQVSGRAGRADRPGRVLLQTTLPEHPVMAALAAGDPDAFLAAEKAARKDAAMPPYGRLVALIVSGENAAEVEGVARYLGQTAPQIVPQTAPGTPGSPGVQVLGPAPAPFALLRGRHRQRLLLKAPADMKGGVQGLIRVWLARVRPPRGVRIQVDVDPISFF